MANTLHPNYYLGVVVAVTPDDDDRIKQEKEWHEILVDVPGVIQGVRAFPMRGEVDEPMKDDRVLVLDVDPLYHSYMLYQKLKENDFIGFRASGKMVDITPDYIKIGVFYDSDDGKDSYPTYKDEERPECKDYAFVVLGKGPDKPDDPDDDHWITKDKQKCLSVMTKGNCSIDIEGDDGCTVNIKKGCKVIIKEDAEVKIEGEAKVEVKKKADIKCEDEASVEITKKATVKCKDEASIEVTKDCNVKGQNVNIEAQQGCKVKANANCEINSPQVKITGGMLQVNGSAAPTGSGPFCALPACLFTGSPHVGGIASGT